MRNYRTFGTVLILLIAGAFIFARLSIGVSPDMAPEVSGDTVSTLTKEYRNDTYNFSLKMPESFEAREVSGAIVLENASGDGIQISISPFDEDLHELTEARIEKDVPDLKVLEPQVVVIGSDYTGLAFKSDNEAFDGASREVWFVFRGNLYQISTYERLYPLLKAIFGTWRFF